jgi:hypothetical protein
MKVKKRSSIERKREKILRDMKKKRDLTEKMINKNRSEAESRSRERIQKSMEQENMIKSRMEEHYKSVEKKRLLEEKRSNKRLLMFSTNNIKHLEEIKDTFSTRINQSMNNFQNQMKELEFRNMQTEQEKKEKTFQKFQQFVKIKNLIFFNFSNNFSIFI